MSSVMKRRSFLVFVLCCIAGANFGISQNAAHWVGTWAAAPIRIDNSKGTLGTADFTLRQIVHTSLGGKQARIVVTNEMGTMPLTIGAAQVAVSSGGTEIAAGSAREIRFNGRASVTIQAGAKVFSDSFPMDLAAGTQLAVSFFVPTQRLPNLTVHSFANQSNYIAAGNEVGAKKLTNATDTDSWHLLSAIEVLAPASSGGIVAFGDSITDGAFSSRSANLRWPDDLARRLQANPKTRSLAVLNEGIGGNRLLHPEVGATTVDSGMGRFDRDVLSQAGVRYLILLEGINDIGIATKPQDPHDPVTVDDLVLGITQLIERAHTHGIKVYVGTIMPDKGLGFYYSEAGEALRQAVNQWIRTTKLPDGVIDFDKALRDPQDVQRLLPAYDLDHIHPNNAGHQAMADAIDLGNFTR